MVTGGVSLLHSQRGYRCRVSSRWFPNHRSRSANQRSPAVGVLFWANSTSTLSTFGSLMLQQPPTCLREACSALSSRSHGARCVDFAQIWLADPVDQGIRSVICAAEENQRRIKDSEDTRTCFVACDSPTEIRVPCFVASVGVAYIDWIIARRKGHGVQSSINQPFEDW